MFRPHSSAKPLNLIERKNQQILGENVENQGEQIINDSENNASVIATLNETKLMDLCQDNASKLQRMYFLK